MMVKLLVYGYCTGTYSSRKIAGKLADSAAFRFLAAGNEPDYRTVSDFRKRHAEALEGLFDQVLEICRQAGLVKLGRAGIGGTKIRANASKHKAMSYGRMKPKASELRREVREMFKRAEQIDAEEDRLNGPDKRDDEMSEEFAETRLKKIREAKAALEAQARDKAVRTSATSPTRTRRSRRSPTGSSRATTRSWRWAIRSR